MPKGEVLCFSLGPTATGITDYLSANGWLVLRVCDDLTLRRLLSAKKVQVGLLLIEDISSVSFDSLQLSLGWARGVQRLEWVAVLPLAALDTPAGREFVLNSLYDHHTDAADFAALEFRLFNALRQANLRARVDGAEAFENGLGMVGHSDAILQLQNKIKKVALTQAPVLIGGESGSGKELAARAIHQCSSRADGPFVAVNCGAIAPALIQSELFGHERGAFTGAATTKIGLIEAASGGTLFLDEIADLPLELQTNLLRFLQERTIQRVGSNKCSTVNVRVIAASHVDLVSAVAAGRFREDLFYRLSVLPITVPSLRERQSDVLGLAQHFLNESVESSHHVQILGFSKHAVEAMMFHTWPGNVRELSNRVKRAVVMTDQRLISPEDLGLTLPVRPIGMELEAVRTLAERDAITLALVRVDSNVTHAARALGISRMTMYRLMDKHGLSLRRIQ
ncbi:MAG: sigma 54-interacting transcriptional regulator [Polaromonas sp.]|nr:sigma 54-interacting transcriptional regulator [Polaromonas sp.]